MKLPQIVKSNYYKGLLVLSRRDRLVDSREREMLIRIGALLDFDRRFCEITIDDLLSNKHISRRPVVFSDAEVKECFFRDALRVALSDGHIHALELRWLRRVAQANEISDEWLDTLIHECQQTRATRNLTVQLDIQKYF